MNSTRRELFFSIAAITLTTLLTYGVLMTRLGFYRDDWYLVWMAQTGNTPGMLSLFAGDHSDAPTEYDRAAISEALRVR